MPRKPKVYQPFIFKQFAIEQNNCAMKIGTDGVLLGAWCDTSHCLTALDIGTGTGLIAIMLAQRSEATIYGVEIDKAAYEQAKSNMKKSPWANRLHAVHGDIEKIVPQLATSFNLIVSNPPYFSDGTRSPNAHKNAVRHTLTLTHFNLLRTCSLLISNTGKICIILPFIEGMKSIEIAPQFKLYCTKITYVKSRIRQAPERVLLQFEKKTAYPKEKRKEKDLIIYEGNSSNYTDDYIHLTKNFYLKM